MFKGEDIRKKRKELKLSAKELADSIKVNVDNLYKWEKGHLPNNPEDFLKIEKWLSGKIESVPSSKNGAVRPQEAQGSPDYRDDIISLLKEKLNSSERRTLQLLQRNHALLKAVVETLPILVSKLEKIKLLEATEEMGKRIEHHLDALKKESI